MITKCKFCGGALKYDADIRRMVCEYCSSMFDVEDTEEEKEYEKMQAMSAGKNPDGAIGRLFLRRKRGQWICRSITAQAAAVSFT